VVQRPYLQLETTRLPASTEIVSVAGNVTSHPERSDEVYLLLIGEFSVGLPTVERDETMLVIRVEKISARAQLGLGMDYKRLWRGTRNGCEKNG
jgi:hypothetical protein